MMLSEWCLLVVVSTLVGLASGCKPKSKWPSHFDTQGLSFCNGNYEYINGFHRGKRGNPDKIDQIDKTVCVATSSPWYGASTQIMYADWTYQLDHNNRWAYCPGGYFLQGMERSKEGGLIHNIEAARCGKPAAHPSHYGHCYNQDIATCLDSENTCKCNAGYYVTGIYRGTCDQLYCIETLRCCNPVAKPDVIDEPYKARVRVMDDTMSDLAYLAHYLGYGWCSSCRAPWVGEDFRKEGDVWMADKTGKCDGYMADKRLSMAYGDWSFGMKNIKYGTPVVEDLTPESIDSGTLINNDATEATKTISRSETSVRSVTHTTTSAWKAGHDLGVEISYSPPDATGGVGFKASYNFNYENSGSTQDENKNEQSKTFTVSTSKTLKPYTQVDWSLMLSKTRSTMSYTATILMRFSAKLQGFLRWGGGYGGDSTNYHYKHRGSGDRPDFPYTFGDAKTPFYTALKHQSETNSRPWMWNDIKNKYTSANSLIDRLTNENRYTFLLTGKFEDVLGKHAVFRWGAEKAGGPSKRDGTPAEHEEHKTLMQVAKPLPVDPPAPTPNPPVVIIEAPNEVAIDPIPPQGE